MEPTKRPGRDDEARAVFAQGFAPIHAAFVSAYRLSEEEAKEAAETLSDWFVRLSHRPGLSYRPAAKLGHPLLLTASACQLAQEYQLWKLDGAPCTDEELKKMLDRDPREVALEILAKLPGDSQ